MVAKRLCKKDGTIMKYIEWLKEQIRLINEDCITDFYKPIIKKTIRYECPLCNLSLTTT